MQNEFSIARGSSVVLHRLVFVNCKNVQIAYRLYITSYRKKLVYSAQFHETNNVLFFVSSFRSSGGTYALNYLAFNKL